MDKLDKLDKKISDWSGEKAASGDMKMPALPQAREVFGPSRRMVSESEAKTLADEQKAQVRPSRRVNYKLPD